MEYSFTIHGHENILATHSRTVEFTKDDGLTKNGDCILGVKADFELEELKKFLGCKRVTITITVANLSETITATPNPKFSSNHELVIRLGEFDSERTFAVRADRAASWFDRQLVYALKTGNMGKVLISCGI